MKVLYRQLGSLVFGVSLGIGASYPKSGKANASAITGLAGVAYAFVNLLLFMEMLLLGIGFLIGFIAGHLFRYKRRPRPWIAGVRRRF